MLIFEAGETNESLVEKKWEVVEKFRHTLLLGGVERQQFC
jgi:hypothetical protein